MYDRIQSLTTFTEIVFPPELFEIGGEIELRLAYPDRDGGLADRHWFPGVDALLSFSAPIRSSLFPDQSNRWAQGRIPPAKQPDSGEDVLGFGGLSAAAQATFANASPGGNPSSVSQSSTLVPVSCS